MSDPAGGMGSSLGVFFLLFFPLQLGLGRIIYKFGYPGGREASCFFFFQLGLGRIVYKFDYPGGRDARFFSLQLKLFLFIEIATTNSHLSISTKPGKNYLTVQELATGFFSPLQVKLFLFREIPQILIYL